MLWGVGLPRAPQGDLMSSKSWVLYPLKQLTAEQLRSTLADNYHGARSERPLEDLMRNVFVLFALSRGFHGP